MLLPDRYSFIPSVRLSIRTVILLCAIVMLVLIVVLCTSPAAHGGGRVELSFGYGPRVQVITPDGARAVQFESSNLSTPVTITLRSLTLDQLLDRYPAAFNRDPWSNNSSHIPTQGLPLIKTWQQPLTTDAKDWWGIRQETIVPASVPPGLYVLSIDHPLTEADELLLIISPYTLMLKHSRDQVAAWASTPRNEPIGNLRVRAFDEDRAVVAEGVTDAQGRWVTLLPADRMPQIVIGEKDGFITLAGLSHDWEFDNWTWWWHPQPVEQPRAQIYLYTDRPIYRPGQTVYVKAWARYDNDAVYSRIPLDWDVIVRLRDARDNVIETQTLHVNEFGTLATSFELAEGGTLGEYHVEAQIKDDVFRQSFKVEEYRKPEYEVTVILDRANVTDGQPLTVTVEARTYFGAPLAHAQIDLNALARSYETWWYDDEASVVWQTLPDDVTGRTDEQGRWVGVIRPDVNSFTEYRHAVPILIEATVKDSNSQAISAHASATVHEAAVDFTPVLVKHYFHPNELIPVSLFARDIDGQPRANVPVTAELLGYVYGKGFTKSIGRITGRTDAQGSVTLNLKAVEQDWYRVRVTGVDRTGKSVERFTWVWVYDPSRNTPWHAAEADQKLEINTDRDAYVSGDTAQLIIRTPVSGKALLTVERGQLRRAQLIELTTPVTLIPLTLQDDDAPNVYVTVNVYRPPVVKDDYQAWQSKPDAELLVARTNVPVSADQRRLRISLTPDRTSYAPRDTVSLTVQITDQAGQPVKTELSLALVDEAIYALSQDQTTDPFEAFYAQRGAAVRTFNSFAPVRWLPCECGGGGGGEDLLANPRFNFPDTAYWNPRIVTDEQGRALVNVTLPDSLTRWRAVVRAVTADEFPRVGEAVAKITTTQPIVIRPVLPRQLVRGDRVLISAIVHNNTDRDRTAVVWADFSGTRINTDNTDSITQTIAISANNSAVVGWPIEVQTLGALTVTMRVKSDKATDAARLSVPIGPLAVPEVDAIIGNTTSSAEHTIELPANTIKEISTLQIDLSPSIAASILDGLAYLTGYPYGCVEQTMSKALPNAVVGRAFNALGVDNPQLKAELLSKVNAGLQRLYGFQHNDGGWGWWFDDSTDDYQTAYVLFGLAMTKQAGYEVDQGVIDRGAKYMTERLPDIGDDRTRAYALFALAMNGKGQLAETQQLAVRLNAITDTQRLDVFSQASLAISLHELSDDTLAQKVIDRLMERAVVTDSEAYWNTGETDGHYHQKTMSSSMRSTALALDAIVRIRPDDPIVTKIVRWLMAHRAPDGWGTTQETAYAVVALTDYLRASGELNSGSTYRVYVNDQLVQQGTLSGKQIQQTIHVPATQLRDGANRIRLERDRSNGQLYYKITQQALIAGSTDRAAGPIEVTRTYRDPKSNKLITNVQPGDVIKVEVKVTMPDDSWYVAIEDPLPGGLEGVNERLNTTSFTARQQDYYGEPEEFFYQDYGYNNKEIHDDRVVFFVTHLDKGIHTFTYLVRATQAGVFNAMPAQVYLMYAPEQWGRSASGAIRVGEISQENSFATPRRIAKAKKLME